MKRSMLSAVILATLGLSATFSALAVNFQVNLCAGTFQKDLTPGNTMDTETVTMWGYSMGTLPTRRSPGTTGCEGPFTSPGPRITIPDYEDSTDIITGLDIKLTNTLPRPTSLVIPGTVKRMSPVFFTPAGESVQRVKSFDTETAVGETLTYSWNNLKPGSYMYHSGTHPQVQVQMGLYGAVIDDFKSRMGRRGSQIPEVYPGVSYTQDIVLFYSEIDRVIHEEVALGNYNETDMQSTIGYAPKYFFIDVDEGASRSISYQAGDQPTLSLSAGLNPLVRFFNAGQRIHIPTVFNASFDIIAEDGKLYPNLRKQYSVELPPLKTKDTLLKIDASAGGVSVRLTDSSMAISNPAGSASVAAALNARNEIANGDGNGMVLNIEVMPESGYVAVVSGPDAPVARSDRMTVREGGSINSIMVRAMSNDSNVGSAVADILSYPKQGELISDGGAYRYVHDGGEESQDSFIYSLTNAAGESATAGVLIDVAPMNDPPVANNDTVEARVGQVIEIRALRNDEDLDSQRISITGVDTSALGSLTALEQVIVFEPATEGSEDVTYTIADNLGASASAVLHLNVSAAAATDSGNYASGSRSGSDGSTTRGGSRPEALDDAFAVTAGQVLDTTSSTILSVMANDSFGALVNPNLVAYPAHGAIQMNENGTFVYTHDGSDSISDQFTYEIYNDYGSDKAAVNIKVAPKAQ